MSIGGKHGYTGITIFSCRCERIQHYKSSRITQDDVTERLNQGLLDFGILIEPADIKKYDFIKLPTRDRRGLLMRRDHPLAMKQGIKPEDLHGIPLIASHQSLAHNELSGWLGKQYESLHIVTTYNLFAARS